MRARRPSGGEDGGLRAGRCAGWTELALFEAMGLEPGDALRELNARIERCVRWYLGEAAEGDVLEVCHRVREKIQSLHRRGFSGTAKAFRVYLYRVVASQAIEFKKDAARWISLDALIELPCGEMRMLRDIAADLVATADDGASKRIEAREEGELVRIALGRLDERCRRLLWAREVEEHSPRDIAAGLTLTETNVAVSLHRCRERLYRLLLAARCAALDREWEDMVARLGDQLAEPLRTTFRLWWRGRHTVREIAERAGRPAAEVRDCLARAKAAVWQLAQEAGVK